MMIKSASFRLRAWSSWAGIPRRSVAARAQDRNEFRHSRNAAFASSTTTPSSGAPSPSSNASSTSSTATTTAKRKPEFYVARLDRGNRPVFNEETMAGETRLARNSRTCPTRELYFLHGQWGRHKSPYRKFRHMANLFQSAPFQRLMFPDLFCVGSLAGALTYYNEFVVGSQEAFSLISMSPTAFAGATTAIGLLAGFRLNNSYGRYNEGRKAWSDTQTILRNFARQIMMFTPAEGCQAQKSRLLRLCQAFPVAFLFHLNDKGCHYNMKRLSKLGDKQFYERVQAEFEAELADIYGLEIDYDNDKATSATTTHSGTADNKTDTMDLLQQDYDRLCAAKARKGHVPLEVLICMGEALAFVNSTGKISPHYLKAMEENIQGLCQTLGSGERISKTPLPTGFSRHSSRLLFMWSNSLPFALYPLLGPLGTLPTTLLTTYAVLGIEDISIQLEEPFDILPLRQFSNTMYDSINAIEGNYRPPVMTSGGTSAT